jgi:hypothetical protein
MNNIIVSTHSLPEIKLVSNLEGQTQWLHGLRHGSVAACLLGFQVWIPLEAWMSVAGECYVLCKSLHWPDYSSRRVLQTVVCVTECDHEASTMRRPWLTRGRSTVINKQKKKVTYRTGVGQSIYTCTHKELFLMLCNYAAVYPTQFPLCVEVICTYLVIYNL